MRVMVIVKASEDSEKGVMPTEEILRQMGEYNEALGKAGVILAGEWLHPSSRGKRVRFSGDQRTVIDGPFAETNELIAGYWIWKVTSMDEAIDWLKKARFDGGTEMVTPAVVEACRDDLAPYEVGKGTIRFPLDQPVPVELIARIATVRAQEAEAGRRRARVRRR